MKRTLIIWKDTSGNNQQSIIDGEHDMNSVVKHCVQTGRTTRANNISRLEIITPVTDKDGNVLYPAINFLSLP